MGGTWDLNRKSERNDNDGMDEIQGSPDFRSLPEPERQRYRNVSRSLVEMMQRYAFPLCLAPPLSVGGEVVGATGCLLRLNRGLFIVTANHVLSEYEERVQSNRLNWQFGHLPPFDPLSRVAWRDQARDIVFLEISAEEAIRAGNEDSLVFSAARGWPPPVPTVGQPVLIAGYPRILREVADASIQSGPYSAVFRTTSAGPGYFYCQIENEELISFDGGELPPPDADVGGLSGGPASLMLPLDYPLVGIVVEHSRTYNILRIATFEEIPEDKI